MTETHEDQTTAEDQRTPGFKRALIGKLIAVGIFVALGTVGVFYSMKACKNCDLAGDSPGENQVAESSVNQNEEEKTADPGKTKLKVQPVSTTAKTKLPAINNPSKLPSQKSNAAGNRPERFAMSSRKPGKQSGDDNGFVSNPISPSRVTTQRPASKSFKFPAQSGTANGANNNFPANPANPATSATITPLPKKNGANSIDNGFQQLRDSTANLAKGAVDRAKSTTNGFSDKANNALRNLNSRAAGLSNNLLGNASTQNANRAPGNNNSVGSSNALPGAKKLGPPPNRTFDQSKTLEPFAPQKSAASSPSNLRDSRPVVVPGTTAAPPITRVAPMQRNPLPASSRIGNQAAGLNPPPAKPVSTPLANAANRMTRPTPGDRKLDGMQSPTLTIERIAPTEIQVNSPADFQYVIKNVGRATARNVKLFDEIPAGTELIQAVPQPSRGIQRQVSWDLDELAPGQEKRIKMQLRPIKPGEIGSVAEVTFSTQASMRTKVTKPVLSIRHAIQPRVLIGDPVTLDIDIKNDGDGPARDVVIQEDLPEGLEFSEGFRELEYAIGTLGPGQSKKVSLELKAAKIGRYRNTLVAYGSGGLQTQHAVDLEVVAPKLIARGEGPTRRFLNREATHRFSVNNTGTANATNVELACKLPSGLRFVSANNRGQYDENSHAVYWSLAELNAGLVANVELTTVPTEPGNQDLSFRANADLGQAADAICKLAVEHLVDIFFDIDDVVDPIEIGSATAYKLRIVNQGTKTATNIQLSVEFPRGIQPTAVEGNITSEIRGQQIAFSPITSMNPGDEIEIMMRGKGLTPGDHKVVVNLISDGREVNVSKQESTRVYSDR